MSEDSTTSDKPPPGDSFVLLALALFALLLAAALAPDANPNKGPAK